MSKKLPDDFKGSLILAFCTGSNAAMRTVFTALLGPVALTSLPLADSQAL
jgi:hypothetical protein